MATSNYSWNLPTVGGSEDAWGTQLNANWTALDTLLGGVSQAQLNQLDGNIFTGNLTVDTNTLFVDASTNRVGIGTSSPAERLHVVGTIIGQANDNYFGNYPSGAYIDIGNLSTSEMWLDTRSSTLTDVPLNLRTKGSGEIKFTVGASERARINASGSLLVNTTTSDYGEYLKVYNGGSYTFHSERGGTGSEGHVVFSNLNGAVGSIFTDGTATSYNTSSDYRLKENVVPLAGAADRLAQIPVHRFNFISDPDKTVDGFLAHEVQAFVPEAVTGEKDAVDNDGKPVYQGIDQSKLVPLLTAALQEALTEIADLKARVAAL